MHEYILIYDFMKLLILLPQDQIVMVAPGANLSKPELYLFVAIVEVTIAKKPSRKVDILFLKRLFL